MLDQAVTQPPNAYHEFIDSILKKRRPLADAEDGIKVQMILDGLYRSAAEGREIRFDK